jgi:RimJ/RimL family protein N-acetyltransferase
VTVVVKLRPVGTDDEAMLLDWANDPATREASRVHVPISTADHHRWLERRLATPDDARLWIGESDGVPIGVVRFERRSPSTFEVSITVAPDARGRGMARPLLEGGLLDARDAFGPVTILADILPGNDASVRLFKSAGFVPVAADAADLRGSSGVISLELRG